MKAATIRIAILLSCPSINSARSFNPFLARSIASIGSRAGELLFIFLLLFGGGVVVGGHMALILI